jgi:hypothetical protein
VDESLRPDNFACDQIGRWLFEDDKEPGDLDAVRRILELVADKQPYTAIDPGHIRDLASGDVEFIVRPGLSVVVVPFGEEADTFSVRFIGDVDAL